MLLYMLFSLIGSVPLGAENAAIDLIKAEHKFFEQPARACDIVLYNLPENLSLTLVK